MVLAYYIFVVLSECYMKFATYKHLIIVKGLTYVLHRGSYMSDHALLNFLNEFQAAP